MRNLIFLLTFIFCTSAFAQTALLNIDPKAPQPTKKQIEEALEVQKSCDVTASMNLYYDCACVSAYFLDLRARRGDEVQQIDLITQAQRSCANKPAIAGLNYQRCMRWAPEERNDYESYCRCFANSYARNFSARPTNTIRGREAMMTTALNNCNKGDALGENRARDSLIEQLKQSGIYRYLFPGATTP